MSGDYNFISSCICVVAKSKNGVFPSVDSAIIDFQKRCRVGIDNKNSVRKIGQHTLTT